jgi:hypothetical protein
LTDETWSGFRHLSASHVEKLIDICDVDVEDSSVSERLLPPFSVFRRSPKDEPKPGLLSDSDDLRHSQSLSALHPLSDQTASHDTTFQRQHQICRIDFTPQLTILKAPRAENRLDPCDSYLFHHYISHVAPVLTPVHTCQNPWLRYPAIALHQSFAEGRKHLLHAMMALTAMWLSEAGGGREDMSKLGTKLYSTAMAELRSSIDDQSVDYLGLLTTILTFLFIEVSDERFYPETCSSTR